MRSLMLALGVVLITLAGRAPLAAQAQATPPAPAGRTPADIDAILKQRLGDVPGLAIVVGLIDGEGKRTIIAAGSTGGAGQRPPDGDTVFEIGSVTKVFTSTLLADMVRRGQVSLDEPVARLLPPAVHVPSRDGREITLLTLATHTSALPRMPDNFTPKDPENPYADYTVDQLYRFLAGCTLSRPIGDTYEYSNLGAGLLGHALALKAGKSYEAAVIERVLDPLGMKDTRITLTPAMRARLAAGHTASGHPAANWDLPTLAGAGALRSTANDMLTFLAASLGLVASPLRAALDETHVARHDTVNPPGRIGLAWHIRTTGDAEITWHNGGTGGYHSFVGFDAKRRTAVVVLHNSAASVDDIGFHLLDPSLPLAGPRSAPKARTEIAVDPAVLDAYVGNYALSPSFVITVTREGGQLYVQATGQGRLPVFAESETQFFLKVVDAQITFVKDASGRATELVLHQNGLDQRARRQ